MLTAADDDDDDAAYEAKLAEALILYRRAYPLWADSIAAAYELGSVFNAADMCSYFSHYQWTVGKYQYPLTQERFYRILDIWEDYRPRNISLNWVQKNLDLLYKDEAIRERLQTCIESAESCQLIMDNVPPADILNMISNLELHDVEITAEFVDDAEEFGLIQLKLIHVAVSEEHFERLSDVLFQNDGEFICEDVQHIEMRDEWPVWE